MYVYNLTNWVHFKL